MYKDALMYKIGEVYLVQVNQPNWGQSYRIEDSDSSTGNEITLDRDVDTSNGETIYIRSYVPSTGAVTTKSYTVDSVSGPAVVLTTGLSDAVERKDIVAIGTTLELKKRRIISKQWNPDHTFTITFEQYDPDLFDIFGITPVVDYPEYSQAFSDNRLAEPVSEFRVNQLITNLLPPGTPAKLVNLTATSQVFAYDSDGNIIVGQTISFAANTQNTTGDYVRSLTSPIGGASRSFSTGGSTSDDEATITGADFDSWAQDDARVAITRNGITDFISIYKVQDGSDGADGVDGSDGVVGLLTNENHSFPASPEGVVESGDYAAGATEVNAYAGSTKLLYAASGNSTYSLGTLTIVPADKITITPSTVSDQRVLTPSAFDDDTNLVIVTVPIIIRDAVGAEITLNRILTYGKSKSSVNDVDIPWPSNLTWSSGGSTGVAEWSNTNGSTSILLRISGVLYEITADDTTAEFIYWDPNFTTVFRATNNINEALSSGNWLMAVNKDGEAYPANGMQLIHAGVLLAGTIRAEQYAQLRQTMPWTYADACDASHPFTIDFKIPSETDDIISVKLSFKIKAYRAYSTGNVQQAQQTSSDGGGQTSSVQTADFWSTTENEEVGDVGGWTDLTQVGDFSSNTEFAKALATDTDDLDLGSHDHTMGTHKHTMGTHDHEVTGDTDTADGTGIHDHGLSIFNVDVSNEDPGDTSDVDPGDTNTKDLNAHKHGQNEIGASGHKHGIDNADHKHQISGANHNHGLSMADHAHTVSDHYHTIAAHNHSIVFGIYEEDNSPVTLHYNVDNGGGFGASSGDFTGDQTDIELVSVISGTGWKAVRFTVDKKCRIVASIEVKVDVTA